MDRPERKDLGPVSDVDPGSALALLANAWECPRCYLVTWDTDGMPRCRRCGFRDTAS
jgi:hypothetical protein